MAPSCASTSSPTTTTERPFSRDQRSWIYTSAKRLNNYFGFGTDNDLEASPNYLIIKHATLPLPAPKAFEGPDHGYPIPVAKVIGAHRGRRLAFRPTSVINISAMSYGALSEGRRCRPSTAAYSWRAACRTPARAASRDMHHKLGGDLVYNFGNCWATSVAATRGAASTWSASRTPWPEPPYA